ncbi:hypothetical protein V8G54_009017 [Vigna mungo]|uniref:DUF676 domain-containing protein n=1 Tax=Vigna mungo TaxID=3915 RepID=A0AAQ3P577_VIGMU
MSEVYMILISAEPVRVKKLKLKLKVVEAASCWSSLSHSSTFLSFGLFIPITVISMDSEAAPQLEEIKQEGVGGGTKKKKKSKKKHDVSGGGFDIEVVDESGQRPTPTHLIIMVNGLVGSAQDWKFAAKQLLKRFPEDAVVHCSERNSSMLTFDGVDVMGDRLAEEVISVIKRHPSVQKISFVGHSLGGMIARYAIARLYGRDISVELSVGNGHCESHVSDQECLDRKYEGKIAGLEPINFITSATPHLGSRGHKQVPMFCGFYSLEKAVSRVAGVFGKTGKHLFLTDSDNGKPPLLLQMVRDSEDIKFFTSSIRRRKELPKRRHLSRHEKYPHIVNVETAKSSCVAEEVPAECKLSSESSKLDSEGISLSSFSTDELAGVWSFVMTHESENEKIKSKLLSFED